MQSQTVIFSFLQLTEIDYSHANEGYFVVVVTEAGSGVVIWTTNQTTCSHNEIYLCRDLQAKQKQSDWTEQTLKPYKTAPPQKKEASYEKEGAGER